MYVQPYEAELMEIGAYRLHKQLYVYVSPIVVVVGVVGNSLSFVVLLQKPLRRVSTYCYLIVLAVADTVVLTAGLLPKWIEQTWGVDVRALTQWTCKMSKTLFTVSDYTVWLIIAVTVERYVVVCHALSARVVCRRRRAVVVMVSLLAGLLALNLHFFWTVGLAYIQVDNYNVTHCAPADGYETLVVKIWPWVDSCVYSFIPLIIIATLNSLIVRHVVSARRLRRQLASVRSTSADHPRREVETGGVRTYAGGMSTAPGGHQSAPSSSVARRRSANSHSSRCEKGQNARMIALLLTVSFTFLAATLPRCATLIATEFINRSLVGAEADTDDPVLYAKKLRIWALVQLAKTATDLLMYTNHAINFFLYCATGQKFRRHLCAVVFAVVVTRGVCHRRGSKSAGRRRSPQHSADIEFDVVPRL